MPSPSEVPILMRRFRGVDISQDAAYIGADQLALSDSFAPNPILVLSKRQGQLLYRQLVVDIPALNDVGLVIAPLLVRTYDDLGHRYAVVIARSNGIVNDTIYTSVDDNTFVAQANTFASASARYGAAQLGSIVYLCNGTDPIIAVTLTSPATSTTNDPFFIGSPAGGGTTATNAVADSAAAEMFPGTYSYAWAVFNSVTKKWTQRFAAQNFLQNPGVGDKSIDFTSPVVGTYTLLANELFHLFLSPVSLPVELASDQTPTGVGNNVAVTIRKVATDGTPVPIVGASRRGNLLLAHRDRLWVSGDQTTGNASRVYATTIILPGAEQALFDQQPYFPTNATLNVGRQDGDRVTAIGRASLTVTTQSPDAPLLIEKNTQTWAFFGDILDDPSAQLLQLSAQIGCPAPFSIVETPVGTIFLGLESVYLVRPDQLIPQDIGFPIAPALKQIPAGGRGRACAVYHRGFYKLAVRPPNNIPFPENSQQWWLDLRRGLGSFPSWWGPHNTTAVIAFANARQDTTELDRAMQLQSQGNIGLMDQNAVYRDMIDDTGGLISTPIGSRIRLSTLDGGAPFDRKVWKRLRMIGRAESTATISVNASLDDSNPVMPEVLTLTGTQIGVWDTAWDISWSSAVSGEAESIFTASAFRAPSRTLSLELAHGDPFGLSIHDLEIRYEPVPRPVA